MNLPIHTNKKKKRKKEKEKEKEEIVNINKFAEFVSTCWMNHEHAFKTNFLLNMND
jgi:hypothetical protein